MKCINSSHPDFIKLLKDSGLNTLELEIRVSKWHEQNNTDTFPTLNQLNNKKELTPEDIAKKIKDSGFFSKDNGRMYIKQHFHTQASNLVNAINQEVGSKVISVDLNKDSNRVPQFAGDGRKVYYIKFNTQLEVLEHPKITGTDPLSSSVKKMLKDGQHPDEINAEVFNGEPVVNGELTNTNIQAYTDAEKEIQGFPQIPEENVEDEAESINTDFNTVVSELGYSPKLENAIKSLFDNLGLKFVSSTDETITADLQNRSISLVNGRITKNQLTEELMHFLVGTVDNIESTDLFRNIQQFDEYWNVANDPEYISKYTEQAKLLIKEGKNNGLSEELLVERLLSIEAIGKLMTQFIEEGDTPEYKLDFTKVNLLTKFWNWLVKSWRTVFKNQALVSPYTELLQKFINQEYTGLNLDFDSNYKFHSLFAYNESDKRITQEQIKAKEVLDKFSGMVINEEGADGNNDYYTTDGNHTKVGRAHDLVDKHYGSNTTGTKPQSVLVQQKYGNKIHSYMENIVQVHNEQNMGVSKTKSLGLGDEKVYTACKQVLMNILKQYEDIDTKNSTKHIFLPEFVIYNPKTKRAGTIDLLVLTPEGNAIIYDWKTMSVKSDRTGEIQEVFNHRKLKSWEVQLQDYELGLKNMGIKVQSARIIPMRVITDFNRGVLNIKDFSTEFTESIITNQNALQPVYIPTDNDIFKPSPALQKLYEQRDKIDKSTPKQESTSLQKHNFYLDKEANLNKINTAIQSITINGQLEDYLNSVYEYLKKYSNMDLSNRDVVNGIDLENLKNDLDYYQDLVSNELGSLDRGLQKILNIAKDEEGKLLINTLEDKYNTKILKLINTIKANYQQALSTKAVQEVQLVYDFKFVDRYKKQSWLTRNSYRMSAYEHPWIHLFYRLTYQRDQKTITDYHAKFDTIKEHFNTIQKYTKDKGLTLKQVYDKLIDVHPETGTKKFTNKHKTELYTRIEKAQQEKDIKFLKSVITFDGEAFDKNKEETLAGMRDNPDTYTENDITDREKYYEKVDGRKSDEYYFKGVHGNPTYYYFNITPGDEWLSDKYKEIQKDKVLLDTFNFLKSTVQEGIQTLGEDRPPNFLWIIKESPLKQILDKGLGVGFNAMQEQMKNLFKEDLNAPIAGRQELSLLPNSGRVDLSVAKYFLNNIHVNGEINNSAQSDDLFQVVTMGHLMSTMYKNNIELEDIATRVKLMFENSIVSGNQLAINTKGKTFNKSGSELKEIDTKNFRDLETFKQFMDAVVYGKNELHESSNFKEFIAKLNSWQRKVNLPLNLMAITANITTGGLTGIMELPELGSGADLIETNSEMARRTEKYTFVVQQLNISGLKELNNEPNKVSRQTLKKYINNDMLFMGWHESERKIRNVTDIMVLKNYKLSESEDGFTGKLVKCPKSESIWETHFKLDKDKWVNTLTKRELDKIRMFAHDMEVQNFGMTETTDFHHWQLYYTSKLLSTYRSWIPNTLLERWGNTVVSHSSDKIKSGRYRTLGNYIFDNHLPQGDWSKLSGTDRIKTIANYALGSLRVLMFLTKDNPYLNKGLKDSYKQFLQDKFHKLQQDNPQLENYTFEEFMNAEIMNQKKMINEITMLLMTYLLKVIIGGMLPPDKQDSQWEKGTKQYISAQMLRSYSEIAFYQPWNYSNIEQIFRSPIPLMSFFTRMKQLGTDVFDETKEEVYGYEGITKNNRIPYDFMKTFVPGSNIFTTVMGIANNQYKKGDESYQEAHKHHKELDKQHQSFGDKVGDFLTSGDPYVK